MAKKQMRAERRGEKNPGKGFAYFCEWVTFGDNSGGHRHGCAEGSKIKILDDVKDGEAYDTRVGGLAGVFVVSQPIRDTHYLGCDIPLDNIPKVEKFYDGRFIPSRIFAEALEELDEDSQR